MTSELLLERMQTIKACDTRTLQYAHSALCRHRIMFPINTLRIMWTLAPRIMFPINTRGPSMTCVCYGLCCPLYPVLLSEINVLLPLTRCIHLLLLYMEVFYGRVIDGVGWPCSVCPDSSFSSFFQCILSVDTRSSTLLTTWVQHDDYIRKIVHTDEPYLYRCFL